MFIFQIVILLIAYLIGSIPSSFLIVRYFNGLKITSVGSGNVGAMNSYEVTGNKLIGFLCFLADFLKGSLSIFVIISIFGHYSYHIATALIGAVIGHNWSIFLKFKGGRGLSTAAGGLAITNPSLIIFWLINYFIAKKIITKNVHIANTFASIIAPILLVNVPFHIMPYLDTIYGINPIVNKVMGSIICLLIILKHIDPLWKLYKSKKS